MTSATYPYRKSKGHRQPIHIENQKDIGNLSISKKFIDASLTKNISGPLIGQSCRCHGKEPGSVFLAIRAGCLKPCSRPSDLQRFLGGYCRGWNQRRQGPEGPPTYALAEQVAKLPRLTGEVLATPNDIDSVLVHDRVLDGLERDIAIEKPLEELGARPDLRPFTALYAPSDSAVGEIVARRVSDQQVPSRIVENVKHVAENMRAGSLGRLKVARPSLVAQIPKGIPDNAAELASDENLKPVISHIENQKALGTLSVSRERRSAVGVRPCAPP